MTSRSQTVTVDKQDQDVILTSSIDNDDPPAPAVDQELTHISDRSV